MIYAGSTSSSYRRRQKPFLSSTDANGIDVFNTGLTGISNIFGNIPNINNMDLSLFHSKLINDYLNFLEKSGIVRYKENVGQTDSFFYTPYFSGVDKNLPFVDGSKLYSNATSGYDYGITIGGSTLDDGVIVTPGLVEIDLATHMGGVNPTLSQNGWFVSCWTNEGISDFSIVLKRGDYDVIRVSSNNTSVDFSSVLMPTTNKLSFTNRGAGLYMFNIRRIHSRVRKNSSVKTQPSSSTRVHGYTIEIRAYFIGPTGEPITLGSFDLQIDPKFNFENEYLYKNTAELARKRSGLNALSAGTSKRDLLNKVISVSAISDLNIPTLYLGRRSIYENSIEANDIINFNNKSCRLDLNKEIIYNFKNKYDNTPLLDSDSDRSADRVLNRLYLTEDILTPYSLRALEQPTSYGVIPNQPELLGSFIYDSNYCGDSYKLNLENKGNRDINISFLAGGNGINTLETAYEFMHKTRDLVINTTSL